MSKQTRSLRGLYNAKEKISRHAMQEFGPGKKGLIFCNHGEAVYYKKMWHPTALFFVNPPDLRVEKGIRFKLCPAHEMLKNRQYEGEIIIKNIPAEFKENLINLIDNMNERAMKRDVLDRVLDSRLNINDLRVTTSENQLAQKIANKIFQVFRNKVTKKISRGKGGDLVSIILIFSL